MPVRFLSDAELARLSSWPDEIADDDPVTYFTRTADDLGWLASTVRVENRLGAAVQLCTLPWLGTTVPDEATTEGATSSVPAKLRSGDVWVPGSRRYTDPATLLIPVETWVAQRDDFCTVIGSDADPTRQLQRLETELHAAVADLERVLADPASEGLASVGEDVDLIVSPLTSATPGWPMHRASPKTPSRGPRSGTTGMTCSGSSGR